MHVHHVWTGTLEGQKKVLAEPLELKLHAVGSRSIWMLVTNLWSSATAAHTFNC